MFTIYSADVTGNPGNCSYPHKHVILDEDSLKAAICHDYVCAEYKNSYDKMVKWLIEEEGFEETDAEEWINYNTIRALDYAGSDSPIIMHALA